MTSDFATFINNVLRYRHEFTNCPECKNEPNQHGPGDKMACRCGCEYIVDINNRKTYVTVSSKPRKK